MPSRADCLEMWEPQPSGTLRACPFYVIFDLRFSHSIYVEKYKFWERGTPIGGAVAEFLTDHITSP